MDAEYISQIIKLSPMKKVVSESKTSLRGGMNDDIIMHLSESPSVKSTNKKRRQSLITKYDPQKTDAKLKDFTTMSWLRKRYGSQIPEAYLFTEMEKQRLVEV